MPTQWEVESVKPTAQNPPPSAPPQQGAGQWEVDSVTPTTTAAAPEQGIVGRHVDTALHELSDLNTGFTSALSQTGRTAEKGINAIPGIGPWFQQHTQQAQNDDQQRASMKLNTTQHMGAAIENILEFAAGDEVLKGASFLAKSNALRPLSEALKKSPQLVQMLGNMIAQGGKASAMSAIQAAAHGGDASTVRHAAEIGGLVGAAAEPVSQGVTKLVQAIKPQSVTALGEEMTALASQRPGAAPLARDVASITSEQGIAGQQQVTSQRALITRAQQVAERELENLNAARQARWKAGQRDINLAPEPETPVTGIDHQLPSGQTQLPAATASDATQLPAGATPELPAGEATPPPTGVARTGEVGPYEGEFPPQPGTQPGAQPQPGQAAAVPPGQPSQRVSYIEEHPANFQPIDAKAESAGVSSFGDAADKIREHAAPIYQRLDHASGGEFTRLRLLRDEGYAANDYNAVRKAEQEIDQLFDSPQLRDKVDRTDYNAAKSAWRSSKILDGVHDVVSNAFNLDDTGLAQDSDVMQGLSGAKLFTGIKRLGKVYGRDTVEQVLGHDGMVGLTRIASLLQSPRFAQQYGQVIGKVSDDIAASAAQTSNDLPKTVKLARHLLLHRIAIDPKFAKFVEYAAKNRIPQKVASAALIALLNQKGGKREGFKPPTIQDKQVVAPDASRGVQPVTLPALTPQQQRLAAAASLGGSDDDPGASEPEEAAAPEEE